MKVSTTCQMKMILNPQLTELNWTGTWASVFDLEGTELINTQVGLLGKAHEDVNVCDQAHGVAVEGRAHDANRVG